MNAVKIKICGLTRDCDIDYANEYQPDYIGFVFAESRRRVTEREADRLKRRLCSGIQAVGVFRNERPEQIAAFVQNGVIDLVQLHGQESEEDILFLKHRLHCPIIRAVSVGKNEEILCRDTASDYLLLDHGAGGTGQTFDWQTKIEIRKPFFLAGGLNAENVLQGIARFHPFAVDVSSGAETDGRKDPVKIQEIIRRVRNE